MMTTMSNSPLVNYTLLSPCHSVGRTQPISRITPHCVVGQASVETMGSWFQNTNRKCAPNYGIGADGRVGLYVNESDRSWCSGGDKRVNGKTGSQNDQKAVTIECASDPLDPYAFRQIVYDKLVALCVDICKRNGKTKLLWIGSAEKTESYVPKSDEMVLSLHSWYAFKTCPGAWLTSRIADLAQTVTRQLQGESTPSGILFRVQVGAFGNKKNAEAFADKVSKAGFPTIIKSETGADEKTLYRVQCGAFRKRQNAIGYVDRLNAAGFDAIIKEIEI